jgi:FeS assembly SUF system protein
MPEKPAPIDLHDAIEDALDQIFDPEIPVSIWQMGLIYDIQIDDQKNVIIIMTLTSPACPVAGTLPRDVQRRVAAIKGVKTARVEVTFEPPWTAEKMSEAARYELGML